MAMVAELSYFHAWVISVYDVSDTVILLNNFTMILSYLQNQFQREFRVFDDIRLGLKAISTIVMIDDDPVHYMLRIDQWFSIWRAADILDSAGRRIHRHRHSGPDMVAASVSTT